MDENMMSIATAVLFLALEQGYPVCLLSRTLVLNELNWILYSEKRLEDLDITTFFIYVHVNLFVLLPSL